MERVLNIGVSVLFFSVISMLLIGAGYFLAYQILENPLPGMCR